MTPKKKMLKKARILEITGWVFLSVLVAIIIFVTATDTDSYVWNLSGAASMLLGVILLLQSSYVERSWWNNLSLGERCEEMAKELKSGKREWYLNSFSSTNYYFAPLSKKNMSEFGGGEHLSANKDEVLRLIKEGKIENAEMAMLVIGHYENIF